MRNEGIIKPLTVERVGSTLADTGRGRLRANARIDALYLNTQNINGSARTLTLFPSHSIEREATLLVRDKKHRRTFFTEFFLSYRILRPYRISNSPFFLLLFIP